MQQAGVDITTFKTHSTRSASTSAAYNAGILVTNIMKAADWKRATTFKRFYHKPIKNSSFGQSTLYILSFEHTLPCMQPFHETELEILQVSKGPDVRLKFISDKAST